MDANRTRYHLLLGYDDWASCTEDGLALSTAWASSSSSGGSAPSVQWNDDRKDVTLRAELFRFLPASTDTPHAPKERRGAARDRYGNWYWISPDRMKILVRWSEAPGPVEYWPVADRPALRASPAVFGPKVPVVPPPTPLGGLAVTEHHYLVVGTHEPPGLLVFDLHAAGAPSPAPLAGGGALRTLRHRAGARRRRLGARPREPPVLGARPPLLGADP